MANSFNRKMDYVNRIREILHNYSADTILQEVLQNADDAKSTTVTVLLHSGNPSQPPPLPADESLPAARESWYAPWIADVNHPALVVVNDSLFTENDFNNLQFVGGSDATTKRRDASKVGRFGVGFNSVFHLTDVAVIVSGTTIVALDPTTTHLPRDDAGLPADGLRWNFTAPRETSHSNSLLLALLDRLEGLTTLSPRFDRTQSYPGTIFRLALRREVTDASLSRVVRTTAQIEALLLSFAQSPRSLCFFKRLTTVKAYHCAHATQDSKALFALHADWAEEKKGEIASREDVTSWLREYTQSVDRIRSHLGARAANDDGDDSNDLTALPDEERELISTWFPASRTLCLELVLHVSTNGSEPTKDRLLVVHHLGFAPDRAAHDNRTLSGSRCIVDSVLKNDGIVVPWAATVTSLARVAPDTGPKGRLHLVFPIPSSPTFPVDIHSYFKVTTSRQSIADVDKNKWNRELCSVVATAYAALMAQLARRQCPQFHLWPLSVALEGHPAAKLIAQETLRALMTTPCIAPIGSGGEARGHGAPDDCEIVLAADDLVSGSVVVYAGCSEEWCAAVSAVLYNAIGLSLAACDVKWPACYDYVRERDFLRRVPLAVVGLQSGSAAVVQWSGAMMRKAAAGLRTPLAIADAEVLLGLCLALDGTARKDDASADLARLGLVSPIELLPMLNGANTRSWHTGSEHCVWIAQNAADLNLLNKLPELRSRLVRHALNDGSHVSALCAAILKAGGGVLKSVNAEFVLKSINEFTAGVHLTTDGAVVASAIMGEPDVAKAVDLWAVLKQLGVSTKSSLRFALSLAPLAITGVNTAASIVDVTATLLRASSPSPVSEALMPYLTRFGATEVSVRSEIPAEALAAVSFDITADESGLIAMLDALAELRGGSASQLPPFQPAEVATLRPWIAAKGPRLLDPRADYAAERKASWCATLRLLPLYVDPRSSDVLPFPRVAASKKALIATSELVQIAETDPHLKRAFETHDDTFTAAESADEVLLLAYLGAMLLSQDEFTAVLFCGIAPLSATTAPTWKRCLEALQRATANTLSHEASSYVTDRVRECGNTRAVVYDALPGRLFSLNTCAFYGLSPLLASHIVKSFTYLGADFTATVPLDIFDLGDSAAAVLTRQLSIGRFTIDVALRNALLSGQGPERDAHLWAILRVVGAHPNERFDWLLTQPIVPAYQINLDSDAVLQRTPTYAVPTEVLLQDAFNLAPITSHSFNNSATKLKYLLRLPDDHINPAVLQALSDRFSWRCCSLDTVLTFLDELRDHVGENWPASCKYDESALYELLSLASSSASHMQRLARTSILMEGRVVRVSALMTRSPQLSPNVSLESLRPHIVEASRTLQLSPLFPLLKIGAITADRVTAVVETLLPAGSRISDAQRNAATSALQVLVEIEGTVQSSTIRVPTADGHSDFADRICVDPVAAEAGKPRVVHSCVPHSVNRFLSIRDVVGLRRKEAGRGIRPGGQKLDLVNVIKMHLRDYHHDTTIFSEMVQNADDAGATEIVFYCDERQHSTDPDKMLWKPTSGVQGPALVVYNNAVFTEMDFTALENVNHGHKRDDLTKIGKFGKGFNTVYHVTDCPTVHSGNRTYFFDPTADHLAEIDPCDPGTCVLHAEALEVSDNFPGQFEPLSCAPYNVALSSSFYGTLIRLPLRQRASKISSDQWTVDRIRSSFQRFAKTASATLLFLRHLKTISLVNVGRNGTVEVVQRVEANTEDLRRAFQPVISNCVRLATVSQGIPSSSSVTQLTTATATVGEVTWQVVLAAEQSLWSVAAAPINAKCAGALHCYFPLTTPINVAAHIHAPFHVASSREDLSQDDGAQRNAALLLLGGRCLARLAAELCARDSRRLTELVPSAQLPTGSSIHAGFVAEVVSAQIKLLHAMNPAPVSQTQHLVDVRTACFVVPSSLPKLAERILSRASPPSAYVLVDNGVQALLNSVGGAFVAAKADQTTLVDELRKFGRLGDTIPFDTVFGDSSDIDPDERVQLLNDLVKALPTSGGKHLPDGVPCVPLLPDASLVGVSGAPNSFFVLAQQHVPAVPDHLVCCFTITPGFQPPSVQPFSPRCCLDSFVAKCSPLHKANPFPPQVKTASVAAQFDLRRTERGAAVEQLVNMLSYVSEFPASSGQSSAHIIAVVAPWLPPCDTTLLLVSPQHVGCCLVASDPATYQAALVVSEILRIPLVDAAMTRAVKPWKTGVDPVDPAVIYSKVDLVQTLAAQTLQDRHRLRRALLTLPCEVGLFNPPPSRRWNPSRPSFYGAVASLQIFLFSDGYFGSLCDGIEEADLRSAPAFLPKGCQVAARYLTDASAAAKYGVKEATPAEFATHYLRDISKNLMRPLHEQVAHWRILGGILMSSQDFDAKDLAHVELLPVQLHPPREHDSSLAVALPEPECPLFDAVARFALAQGWIDLSQRPVMLNSKTKLPTSRVERLVQMRLRRRNQLLAAPTHVFHPDRLPKELRVIRELTKLPLAAPYHWISDALVGESRESVSADAANLMAFFGALAAPTIIEFVAAIQGPGCEQLSDDAKNKLRLHLIDQCIAEKDAERKAQFSALLRALPIFPFGTVDVGTVSYRPIEDASMAPPTKISRTKFMNGLCVCDKSCSLFSLKAATPEEYLLRVFKPAYTGVRNHRGLTLPDEIDAWCYIGSSVTSETIIGDQTAEELLSHLPLLPIVVMAPAEGSEPGADGGRDQRSCPTQCVIGAGRYCSQTVGKLGRLLVSSGVGLVLEPLICKAERLVPFLALLKFATDQHAVDAAGKNIHQSVRAAVVSAVAADLSAALQQTIYLFDSASALRLMDAVKEMPCVLPIDSITLCDDVSHSKVQLPLLSPTSRRTEPVPLSSLVPYSLGKLCLLAEDVLVAPALLAKFSEWMKRPPLDYVVRTLTAVAKSASKSEVDDASNTSREARLASLSNTAKAEIFVEGVKFLDQLLREANGDEAATAEIVEKVWHVPILPILQYKYPSTHRSTLGGSFPPCSLLDQPTSTILADSNVSAQRLTPYLWPVEAIPTAEGVRGLAERLITARRTLEMPTAITGEYIIDLIARAALEVRPLEFIERAQAIRTLNALCALLAAHPDFASEQGAVDQPLHTKLTGVLFPTDGSKGFCEFGEIVVNDERCLVSGQVVDHYTMVESRLNPRVLVQLGMRRFSDAVAISIDETAVQKATCVVANRIEALLRSQRNFVQPLLIALADPMTALKHGETPSNVGSVFADIKVRSTRAINLTVSHRSNDIASVHVAPSGDAGYYDRTSNTLYVVIRGIPGSSNWVQSALATPANTADTIMDYLVRPWVHESAAPHGHVHVLKSLTLAVGEAVASGIKLSPEEGESDVDSESGALPTTVAVAARSGAGRGRGRGGYAAAA